MSSNSLQNAVTFQHQFKNKDSWAFLNHSCGLAAQNSDAWAKLSPGLIPFATTSSLPPFAIITWLRSTDFAPLAAPNALSSSPPSSVSKWYGRLYFAFQLLCKKVTKHQSLLFVIFIRPFSS